MTDPNDYAFPLSVGGQGYKDGSIEPATVEARGLSIREHFAALAMQGIIANTAEFAGTERYFPTDPAVAKETGRLAVLYADALIDALNKTE